MEVENMEERKELFSFLTDEQLKYLKKRMKEKYFKVKRINFDISESYLKDSRAIDLILNDRYDNNVINSYNIEADDTKEDIVEENKKNIKVKKAVRRRYFF